MIRDKADTPDIENTIARYSRLSSALLIISATVAFAAVYMAITITTLFAWGLLILIPLLSVVLYLSGKQKGLNLTLQLRNNWDKPQIAKERPFAAIRLLFDNVSSAQDNSNHIDEQT